MTTTENYGLKKPESNDYVSIDVINENMDAIDEKLKENADHSSNASNPHKVTKSQVGLGSVPNVATNDQTPTYSDTDTLSTLASGEKLSVAFPKIKLAITNLISHFANKNNPHGVTANQIGLGSVQNVSTNDQTPTYTQASTLANLVSGEKLSVSFGKIMKGLADLISHLANKSNPHGVTAEQVGALPQAGGSMTGKLTIPAIEFQGSSSHGGYIDFHFNKDTGDYTTRIVENGAGLLVMDVAGAGGYEILSLYNKPTGSYTGNGSSSKRTIDTGGIGNAAIVRTGDAFALVTISGAIGKKGTSNFVINYNEAQFIDGILYLNTTNSAFNTSGATYEYHVI